MPDDTAARIELLRQMFAGFNQEAGEERFRFYLEIISEVPTKSLAGAILSASKRSGPFPPGPGEIVVAWWNDAGTKPMPSDYGEKRRDQIGPGDATRQMREMAEVIARAKTILEEGKYVPKSWQGGVLLAHIKAAIDLEMQWPLDSQTREIMSAEMQQYEAKGGDAKWWWNECDNPTVTKIQ
jgi:hypothetical protein